MQCLFDVKLVRLDGGACKEKVGISKRTWLKVDLNSFKSENEKKENLLCGRPKLHFGVSARKNHIFRQLLTTF